MRVILRTLVAGPGGCFAPGEQEIPDALAKALVAGGAAVALEATKPAAKEAPAPPVETAQQPRRGETADAHKRRGR